MQIEIKLENPNQCWGCPCFYWDSRPDSPKSTCSFYMDEIYTGKDKGKFFAIRLKKCREENGG